MKIFSPGKQLSLFPVILLILASLFIGCGEKSGESSEEGSGQHAVAVIPVETQAAQAITSPSQAAPVALTSPAITGTGPEPRPTPRAVGTKPKPTPRAIGTKPKPTPRAIGTKPKPTPYPVATRQKPRPTATPTDIRQAITVTVKEQAGTCSAKKVELVLCIDVSGSMQPLINMAKQKLWDIARDIKNMRTHPELSIALISFGSQKYDSASGWVNVETDFTDDFALIHKKLSLLKAGGENEYIAKALSVAVNDLTWSAGEETLRTIFVAGNESIHQDPIVKIADICNKAKEKGIIINSIFCKIMFDAYQNEWEELASLGQGKYTLIEFTEKMFASETPTQFSTKFAKEKPGMTSFQGQVVGIINENDLLIKDSSLGGATKTFKVDGRTRYSPGAWRPSPGDLIILYYSPVHPNKICEIENAQ